MYPKPLAKIHQPAGKDRLRPPEAQSRLVPKLCGHDVVYQEYVRPIAPVRVLKQFEDSIFIVGILPPDVGEEQSFVPPFINYRNHTPAHSVEHPPRYLILPLLYVEVTSRLLLHGELEIFFWQLPGIGADNVILVDCIQQNLSQQGGFPLPPLPGPDRQGPAGKPANRAVQLRYPGHNPDGISFFLRANFRDVQKPGYRDLLRIQEQLVNRTQAYVFPQFPDAPSTVERLRGRYHHRYRGPSGKLLRDFVLSRPGRHSHQYVRELCKPVRPVVYVAPGRVRRFVYSVGGHCLHVQHVLAPPQAEGLLFRVDELFQKQNRAVLTDIHSRHLLPAFRSRALLLQRPNPPNTAPPGPVLSAESPGRRTIGSYVHPERFV